jgi:two-component system response regulator (stage 0 sporulation protein F)
MQEEAAMANILIIDDQPYIQELFSQELMGEGYRVVSACDAESAKAYLENSKPDLVLLDLFLNGFEGWNVLHEIKSKDPHLPVLIVTAYDTYVDDPRVSQTDEYVVKSFVHFDELKHKIADILQWNKNDHCDITQKQKRKSARNLARLAQAGSQLKIDVREGQNDL